jgi:heat shock protein HtpX
VVLIVVAWGLSQLVKLALSRSREYLADAGSVELTKNPDAMISALRKIEGRGELPGATSAVMELCVDNPREGFADVFATHPSVESRVQALVKYAGGHYEGPLALPPPPTEEQRQPGDAPSTGNTPPPVPSGPWSDGATPPALPQGAPQGAPPPLPDTSPGPLPGPWGNQTGPWGRH